jgi:hypothetical protein
VDLEQACDAANAEIAELIPNWDKAEKAFGEALKKIEESEQELKQNWEETKKEAEAFLKEVADGEKDLVEESANTRSAMQDLKKATLSTKEDLEQEIDTQKQALDDFGEQDVHGLESPMEALAKAVSEAASNLEQAIGTIAGQISSLAADTVSFFEGEITNALEENERQVTERHSQLEDWITSSARPDMETKHGDFKTKMTELESQTQSKFDETHQHTETESKSVLDQCLGEHMNTIQQIMSLGQTLSSTLTFLADSVKTTGEMIGTAKQTVETCVETSNITIESIMDCFESFQKICEGFSFLG